MKKVLILGAGLVTRPIVTYLLDKGFKVVVASRTVSKAEALVGDHPNGEAVQLNVKNMGEVDDLIADSDLTISLLPYVYHVEVAERCIEHKVDMVTTSYVSPQMKALDKPAREAGIFILNEIGVDPGIDHMSAMQIIDDVHDRGGKIETFYSLCGGLPAPDDNDNPLGYKFSWSPKGVVLAGRNSGSYLLKGARVDVPPENLFLHTGNREFDGIEYEYYTNRDSFPYIELYGIPEVDTLFRGTIRNLGWCEFWKKVSELGFLDVEDSEYGGVTYKQFLDTFIVGQDSGDLRKDLAVELWLSEDSHILDKFEWLGMFSDEEIPEGATNAVNIFADLLLEKMPYKDGERDMIILAHDFTADFLDHKERIQATMIDYGIPNGDSSMARTVSLPAAIATRMILEGEISGITGVHIPVMPEVYNPVLAELETIDIGFKEKRDILSK
ncbi:MAG: saccharopine dehydrogenase [bacterium]|nr:saccharopine dehydrogenase [bacterium]